jgi:outer membrane protein TolC
MKKSLITIALLALSIYSAQGQEIITLDKCKELALKNNARIKDSEIEVQIAQQQKKEAFTNYFPNVSSMGFGYMANKPMVSMEVDLSSQMQPLISVLSPVIGWAMTNGVPVDPAALAGLQNQQPVKFEMLKNGLVAGVNATQPLFAGGQIINGNRLAQTGVQVRELQKQMTESEVLLSTENYYWQLVSLNEKMKTIEQSESMLARILSDVKVAVENGLTTRNDLLRVELEQNKLEVNRSLVENGLQVLKLTLAQTIGIPSDSYNIHLPQFEEISLPATNVTAATMQNRTEYKLLCKSVDAARLQVKMETGKNLPSLAIGAGYNVFRFDLHEDEGMTNDFGLAFASVSIPITDWWGGSHDIKRKKLELEKAENTRDENAELLLIQMQQISNELNQAYNQVLIEKKSIKAAEENLKISQDNYNAGITILSELLEAQNLLQQATDRHTEALTCYFTKLAEWKSIF